MSEQKKEKIFTKGAFANERTGQLGKFMNIDFKVDEFIEFMKANMNEKGYCKVTFYPNKPGSTAKNSHYGVLNDYVPNSNKPEEKPKTSVPAGEMQQQYNGNSDDLPF